MLLRLLSLIAQRNLPLAERVLQGGDIELLTA
jgi:hypothetical protein